VDFLTDRFEKIPASERAGRGLLGLLRADMAAKSAWYHGRVSRGLAWRMLVSDGSLCTVLYRLMRALGCWHLGAPAAVVYKLNVFLTGAVIGRGAQFGPGLIVLHSVGLVVNTAVRGGDNVVLEGSVTVGAEKGRSPVLGDNVFIGTGARLIGGVSVGSGARIGANAVVVKDVPAGATAVGVPAKVVRTRGEGQ
jgi:serine O-acetyltransferase